MTDECRLRADAELDVAEAARRYEWQRAGLGEDFLDAVQGAFADIEEMPTRFAVVESGVRRALLRRYPYAVYFTHDVDHVEVIAVLHLHRRPGSWHRE